MRDDQFFGTSEISMAKWHQSVLFVHLQEEYPDTEMNLAGHICMLEQLPRKEKEKLSSELMEIAREKTENKRQQEEH